MSAMLDYMQLCRLCLVKEKVNVPIFGDDNDVRQIFLKITACLPVKVAQEDNLPKKICDSCLYKVDLLYQFWNTTVNAEKQLIQWLTELGVDVNIKNSDTQTLPILPQSHAHPHSIPVPVLKEEGPDIVEKPPDFQMPEQQNIYPGYDNLGYPQAEVTMEVGAANTFVQPEPVEDPPPPDPPAPTPKKRGRPAGATNKKAPPKKKPTPAPPPVVSPRTNSTRRSSATAAAAAVAAAAAAATDSEEDSDGDRLGGLDYEDSDSDEDHMAKEELDSDEDYVKPKSYLGVPSSADGEQPGPSGLGGVKGEATGANATESGQMVNVIFLPAYVFSEEKKYICKICSKSFNTAHEKRNHSRSHIEPHIKCPECDKKFKFKNVMERHHLQIHQSYDKRPHVCHECDMRFVTNRDLQAHVDVKHEHRYRFTCCDKFFANRLGHDRHMRTVHMGQRFICFPCNKPFRSASYLQQHRIRKHDPDYVTEVFQCGQCDKSFYTRRSYTIHMKEHINGPSVFVCDVCGKTVTSAHSLRNHKALHTGEKTILCPVCGKRFNNKKYLRVHEVIHTKERKYACDQCDKKFTQRGTLVIHLRYHTGERPYPCSLCDKAFVSRSLLNTHFKVHENVDVKVENNN